MKTAMTKFRTGNRKLTRRINRHLPHRGQRSLNRQCGPASGVSLRAVCAVIRKLVQFELRLERQRQRSFGWSPRQRHPDPPESEESRMKRFYRDLAIAYPESTTPQPPAAPPDPSCPDETNNR